MAENEKGASIPSFHVVLVALSIGLIAISVVAAIIVYLRVIFMSRRAASRSNGASGSSPSTSRRPRAAPKPLRITVEEAI
uniref:Transmembrane protein n=1 Tax=Panagrellus redivivus TaxID=6233 RepID=A0A7E4VCA5_PANRE